MQETQETQIRSLDQEYPLEKGMATHSSILAWRSPWTEEPGRLQSMGSQSQTRMKQPSTHISIHVGDSGYLDQVTVEAVRSGQILV